MLLIYAVEYYKCGLPVPFVSTVILCLHLQIMGQHCVVVVVDLSLMLLQLLWSPLSTATPCPSLPLSRTSSAVANLSLMLLQLLWSPLSTATPSPWPPQSRTSSAAANSLLWQLLLVSLLFIKL